LGWTEMSQEELRRVEVLARVRSNQLRVVDASRLLGESRQFLKVLPLPQFRISISCPIGVESAGS